MKSRIMTERVSKKTVLAETAEHLAEWIKQGRPHSDIAGQLSLLIRGFASDLPTNDLQVIVDYLGAQIQTQVLKSASTKRSE